MTTDHHEAPSNGLPQVSRRHMIRGGLTLGVAVALGAAASSAQADATSTTNATATAEDEAFMRMAIEEASKADFPFGAVIVKDGKVLATGRNSGKIEKDPTAHGEMVAIRNFLSKHPPEDLQGTTLYTSGEPCAMCMGAILWCGVDRLVFAASVDQLATKIDQIMLSSEAVAKATSFSHIQITGGVLAAEAMALFDKAN